MTTDQRCVEKVEHGWNTSQCSRAGKVLRDKRWFCVQHDPERREAANKQRSAAWKLKWEIEKARADVVDAEIEAGRLLTDRINFPGLAPELIAAAETVLTLRKALLALTEPEVCPMNSIERLRTLETAEKAT